MDIFQWNFGWSRCHILNCHGRIIGWRLIHRVTEPRAGNFIWMKISYTWRQQSNRECKKKKKRYQQERKCLMNWQWLHFFLFFIYFLVPSFCVPPFYNITHTRKLNCNDVSQISEWNNVFNINQCMKLFIQFTMLKSDENTKNKTNEETSK